VFAGRLVRCRAEEFHDLTIGTAVCRRSVSCPVVSCRVLSCRVLSCPVVSCRVLSWPVVSCRVLSCPVVSCPVVSCRVLSCPVVPCRVLSCRVVSVSCPAVSCPVVSCLSASLSLSPSLSLSSICVSVFVCVCVTEALRCLLRVDMLQFQTVASYSGGSSSGTLSARIPAGSLPHSTVQFRVRLDPFTNNNGAQDKGSSHRKGEDVLTLSSTRLTVEFA
jgi:hypothetical protein